MRSEYAANIALARPAAPQGWQRPAPARNRKPAPWWRRLIGR